MIFRTFDAGGNVHVMDPKGLFRNVPAAFLVGGAPSLREQNYRLLEQRGVVTFAMNNVGALFRPTFMVASDEPACFDRRLLMDPSVTKIMWGAYRDKPIRGTGLSFGDLPNVWMYDAVVMRRDSSLLADRNYLDWKRNTFFLGISVMYHLGIRTIVLAGSDFGPDDRGRDYSAGASLSSDEREWNNLLYRYEIADMVRLKGVFDDYGLSVYDTSLHSKICRPAGPYDRITLEEGVDMCLKGFPKEHDTNLPHVSRLHDRSLMDQVLAGKYTVVDEKDTLYAHKEDTDVAKGDTPSPAAPAIAPK
jgi:hypothetical protein